MYQTHLLHIVASGTLPAVFDIPDCYAKFASIIRKMLHQFVLFQFPAEESKIG